MKGGAGVGAQSERRALIERAVKLRADIQSIFDDANHWNQHCRVDGETAIDCDPDGEMRRAMDSLAAMIEAESASSGEEGV